ncbi:type VII secretion-associated serine protease mycosin [Actinoplanes tereljensis]|uniref:Type VII secretion-associated serine protease n=1 Tax=Paractinoplanes tereljensis TaxID=571912 RepID=A0A919NUZ9_9ACTN|nr:type VII secretion-associated serine protease mycosin [Actinoplanes tereljensis]GIF24461.1 type VII secretion-associated serine protease [Actinoplanes tereljensis]
MAVSLPTNPAYADTIRDKQEWYLRSVNALQAHSITTGAGVTVAVIDTGTYPHPDLRNNLLKGDDESSARAGDGQTDRQGHGTRMAALIAGHGRGSSGIQGLAPAAKILPIRVAEKAETKNSEVVARGVDFAIQNGASVINISMGGGPDFDLDDAIGRAIEHNIVVVASVGNTPRDFLINYPAANDGVVAVGATGRDGKHASVSVKDAKVQLCAPGVDIISAVPKDGYSLGTGTSDSTAIVSGAAALVRAKFPELSAKDVINRLTATADDIGAPGRDSECGFGRLNVFKALTADVPPLEAATPSAAPSAAATTTVAAPAATTPSAQAEAEPEPASSSTPLVLGVLAGLVVAGGLVAMLVIRRRRNF